MSRGGEESGVKRHAHTSLIKKRITVKKMKKKKKKKRKKKKEKKNEIKQRRSCEYGKGKQTPRARGVDVPSSSFSCGSTSLTKNWKRCSSAFVRLTRGAPVSV